MMTFLNKNNTEDEKVPTIINRTNATLKTFWAALKSPKATLSDISLDMANGKPIIEIERKSYILDKGMHIILIPHLQYSGLKEF